VLHLDYNSTSSLEHITNRTACVVAETVQAEMGINIPSKKWMHDLRARCDEQGVLLILDEIQAAFGRTGTLWAFQQYDITPDIVLLGKALGGGMPLGAFIADRNIMWTLTEGPVLGHITTFGGHPVSCAAGMASFKVLLEEGLMETIKEKEALFHSLLKHPAIKAVRSAGLLMAVEFEDFATNKKIINRCLEQGLITDWFLFAPHCMRIAPPLIIPNEKIRWACEVIMASI
jgi:acetylornithine/succinyldiaminopimelate/putrescine aminotransferase